MAEMTPDAWQALNRHFTAARPLTGQARAAYVAAVRARDEALAGRLESLLAVRGPADRYTRRAAERLASTCT